MRKVRLILLFMFLFSYVLSGCTSDSNEIDDQVYAITIGADKGVENKIRLTIQYPTYKDGGGGGGNGGGAVTGVGGGKEDMGPRQVDNTIVTTIEAPSILEAVNLLNTAISRRISLVHIKSIVFSEEFARKGIELYLEPLARFRETRRTALIIVCRGKAEDYILENKTVIGDSISKTMELMATQSDNTGFFPRTNFHDFYRRVISPYSQPYTIYVGLNDFKNLKPINDVESPLKTQYSLLPGELPRVGDKKQELVGMAVFDGDRMVGSLDSYETRYFLMVTGEFKKGIFSIEDKNKLGTVIPFDLRLGRKPKVKVSFENNVPVIYVHLNIEADLGALQSRIPYERLDRIEDLNKMVKETVQDGVKKTIEKTQREWGVDIFGFGYQAARHFFTINEFEKYNWLSRYKEAKINVHVEANVRRTGLMTESSPIRYSTKTHISKGK